MKRITKTTSLLLALMLSVSCIISCSNEKIDPLQEAFDYVPDVSFEEPLPEIDWDDQKGVLLIYTVSTDILNSCELLQDAYSEAVWLYKNENKNRDAFESISSDIASIYYSPKGLRICYDAYDWEESDSGFDGYDDFSMSFINSYGISNQTLLCLDKLRECYEYYLLESEWEIFSICEYFYKGIDPTSTIKSIKDFETDLRWSEKIAGYYYDQIYEWCTEITETASYDDLG